MKPRKQRIVRKAVEVLRDNSKKSFTGQQLCYRLQGKIPTNMRVSARMLANLLPRQPDVTVIRGDRQLIYKFKEIEELPKDVKNLVLEATKEVNDPSLTQQVKEGACESKSLR